MVAVGSEGTRVPGTPHGWYLAPPLISELCAPSLGWKSLEMGQSHLVLAVQGPVCVLEWKLLPASQGSYLGPQNVDH